MRPLRPFKQPLSALSERKKAFFSGKGSGVSRLVQENVRRPANGVAQKRGCLRKIIAWMQKEQVLSTIPLLMYGLYGNLLRRTFAKLGEIHRSGEAFVVGLLDSLRGCNSDTGSAEGASGEEQQKDGSGDAAQNTRAALNRAEVARRTATMLVLVGVDRVVRERRAHARQLWLSSGGLWGAIV